MKRHTVVLTIFLVISKFLGLLRESVLAYFYGTSSYADIYLTATMIPNAVFGLIATGLVSTLIPIYSKVAYEKGEKRADNYFNNILSMVFLLTILVTGISLIFTEELVSVFASGFSGEKFTVTVSFVRISLFSILTIGFFNLMSGYHQYHNRFLVSPLSGFIMNFIIITTIIVSSYTKPIILAIGIVISSLAQALFSYLVARNKGDYKFKFNIDFKDEYLKPMLMMALPIIIGSSIGQVNNIIDRTIASRLAEGSISTLNYASKISDSIYALFVTTITTVIYPSLTKQSASGDYNKLIQTVTKAINSIFIIVFPAMIGIMVLSEPVVELFYGRGVFGSDPTALTLTAQTTFFYSISIIGYSLRDILTRTFYSLHDSNTPVISAVLAIIVNLILNIILAPRMGVAGLALATSISAITAGIVLLISLYRKIEGFSFRLIASNFIKIGFASLTMGLVVLLFNKYLTSIDLHYLISFGLSVGIGAITYLIIMLFMNVKEFDDIIDFIKDTVNRIFERN